MVSPWQVWIPREIAAGSDFVAYNYPRSSSGVRQFGHDGRIARRERSECRVNPLEDPKLTSSFSRKKSSSLYKTRSESGPGILQSLPGELRFRSYRSHRLAFRSLPPWCKCKSPLTLAIRWTNPLASRLCYRVCWGQQLSFLNNQRACTEKQSIRCTGSFPNPNTGILLGEKGVSPLQLKTPTPMRVVFHHLLPSHLQPFF